MDPKRRDAMRQSFVATVKQMDPIDALVLKAAYVLRNTPNPAITSELTPPQTKSSSRLNTSPTSIALRATLTALG
jgi:hypothetical protein